jgi:hypothetical protein
LLEKDKKNAKFFVGDTAKKYLVSSSPESLAGCIFFDFLILKLRSIYF